MAPSAKKAKIDGDGAPIQKVRSEEEHGGGGGGNDGKGKKEEAEPRGKKKSPAASASPRTSEGSTTPSKKKKGSGGGGFGGDIGDYCYDESSDYDGYHDEDEDEYYDYDEYYDDEEEDEDGKILSTAVAKTAAAAGSPPRRGKGTSRSNGTTNGHGGSAASHAAARGYPSSSDYDEDEYEYDEEEEEGKMCSTSAAKTAEAVASSPSRGKRATKSNGTANGYGGVASKAKAGVAAAASAAAAVAAREEIYISSGDDYDGGYDLFSSRRCAEYDRKSHCNVEDHERIMTAKAAKASSSPPSPLSPIPRRRKGGGGAFFGGGGEGAAIDVDSASSTMPTTREGRLALRREHRAAMHRKMPDLEFLLTLDLEESYDNLADGDDGVMCYADEEEVAEEMAGVAATICRQTGIVVLRCGEKKRPASSSAASAPKKGARRPDSNVKNGPHSSHSAKKASRSGGTGKPNGGGGGPKCSESSSSSASSSSSLPPSSDEDDDSLKTEDFFAEPGHLFSQKMLDELTEAAKEIEIEVCRRLGDRHPGWRGGGESPSSSKISSAGGKNNNTKKTPPVVDFRYHEVALRGAGRIDIRYRMDRYPFNHPAVVKNHLILPIVRDMLNQDANLVYAGLILSFPDSSAQPWHMDGRTLFPELDRDVPPYALNVFVPLDDVSEELGPTELIPGSHTIDQAEIIDEAIVLSLTDGRGGSSMYQMTNVVAPLLQRGDALIYDYRVCHRGTGNLSPDRTRPMLYLMYARGWFKEHVNFGTERLFGQKHVTV